MSLGFVHACEQNHLNLSVIGGGGVVQLAAGKVVTCPLDPLFVYNFCFGVRLAYDADGAAAAFRAADLGLRVVLVERNRAACRALRENAVRLAAQNVELRCTDALQFLHGARERFDVVFLDPPYALDLLPRVFPLLPDRLAERGRVYFESGARVEVEPPWRAIRSGHAGRVHFYLIALESL